MTGGVLDVRLVVARDGTVRASIDGRPVLRLRAATSPSAALVQLGRMVEGAAWTGQRGELEEAADPRSPLYVEAR